MIKNFKFINIFYLFFLFFILFSPVNLLSQEAYCLNNKFLIKGFNDNFIKSKIKSTFKKYNNKNSNIKFYFPILNTPGASNHIGSSFPMSKKSTKWNTRLNGQLSKYKDIHLSDSSVLNQIDMQPITLFTIFNILRMNN